MLGLVYTGDPLATEKDSDIVIENLNNVKLYLRIIYKDIVIIYMARKYLNGLRGGYMILLREFCSKGRGSGV